MLLHGEQVGKHLGWMIFVRKAVVDGYASEFRQFLHGLLAESAILDRIVDAAKYPGRILHRFLVADLRAAWTEVGHMGALVVGGDLEADTGARRSLLEDQRDAFPLSRCCSVPVYLADLRSAESLRRKFDFRRSEIAERQEAPVLKVE